MKQLLLILIGTLLFTGCEFDSSLDLLNRECTVQDKGDDFDIEFSGTYARLDNQLCCTIPGLDENHIKGNHSYTITNSFTYCTEDRSRGNITIFT